MKVKLKKHKNLPAPSATKQTKVKSTIEKFRKTRTYGVPIHVVYDRGYQQIVDLTNRNQKTEEKRLLRLHRNRQNLRLRLI